jgi:GT2 family glycosyltransferase
MTPDPAQNVAIVVIGRNEGERLRSCLSTVVNQVKTVVYVDSGSIDGSPQYAASVNCHVVELDPTLPFSASRARNEGYARLMEQAPNIAFVQFLDGDCDLADGWLEQGLAALNQRQDVGIVCGHVRELYPEATVYNKVCDLEWQQTPGEIRSSGGRFIIRSEIFQAVGGFRPDVIAAEDDEFCVRVKRLGWKILQVDAEMARHDVAMNHFSQWWRRSKRTGHAFGQVSALYGRSEERYFVRDCQRIWLWALALPVLALCLAPFTHGISILVLLCAYLLQMANVFRAGLKRGWAVRDALVYCFFTVLFKFPALIGLLEYHWRHWRGHTFSIIEYKRS